MNVLCIFDENRQRCAIVVDRSCKFKSFCQWKTYDLRLYDIENGATLITNFRQKEEKIIVWTWEKRKQKTEKFSKVSRVDQPETSVQSEQAEPEQCK